MHQISVRNADKQALRILFSKSKPLSVEKVLVRQVAINIIVKNAKKK